MTRDEALQALAEVLMMAAEKAKTLSATGATDGAMSREIELAARLVDIASEFRGLAEARRQGVET